MNPTKVRNKHIKKILSKYLINDIIDIVIEYFSNSREWEIEKILNKNLIPEDIIYIIIDYSKIKIITYGFDFYNILRILSGLSGLRYAD